MNLFWIDPYSQIEKSWKCLIDDLNNEHSYNPYCLHKDPFLVFKHIIFSIIYGFEVTLLDSDFSIDEIESFTDHRDISAFEQPLQKNRLHIGSKNELIELIKNTDPNWKISIFTSGTTGKPKIITHSFKSINRFVKVSDSYTDDIWGYSYNPTHIAGVQVFFQALLNGNTMVKLYGLSKDVVFDSISKHSITNISATPTFYRLLLPYHGNHSSVKRLTSGGERFDTSLSERLTMVFPNAKITNVYASTEAGSLFASEGDVFKLKSDLIDYIRVENSELLLHKSLLGEFSGTDDVWYRSGDIIDIISTDPFHFKFISRKDDMINVGGYKVNPNEVEQTIRELDGVKNAIVYSKPNSILGNIVCCEIISANETIDEVFIRRKLQGVLQEFKIPRVIKFVNEFNMTRSGKLKRK